MSQPATSQDIDSILQEKRVFPPPKEFAAQALVKSMDEWRALSRAAADDPEKFWAGVARELHWFKPWTKVLEWDSPWRNKAAYIWEGEPGEVRTITYQQLLLEVSRLANALKSLGIKKGDRVAIYMGMVPELPT